MKTLFDEVGGYSVIRKVHKVFYDKVFAHPWMGRFFQGTDQQHIEDQQTDFMVSIFGGPKKYMGKSPRNAHLHLFINQDLIDTRTEILIESLRECNVSQVNQMAWLSKDKNFHIAIMKKSHHEAIQRYATEPIVNIPKP